jgi:hypothetical protein
MMLLQHLSANQFSVKLTPQSNSKLQIQHNLIGHIGFCLFDPETQAYSICCRPHFFIYILKKFPPKKIQNIFSTNQSYSPCLRSVHWHGWFKQTQFNKNTTFIPKRVWKVKEVHAQKQQTPSPMFWIHETVEVVSKKPKKGFQWGAPIMIFFADWCSQWWFPT